MGYTQNFVMS